MTPAERAFGAQVEGRLRAAADRLMSYDFKPWFYGDSIGFEGLVAASWLLDDQRYLDFARSFLLSWAARDEPRGPDDNTVPGLVLCELAQEFEDQTLADAALRLGHYLRARRHIQGVPVTFEDASRSLREPYGPVPPNEADRRLLDDPGAGIYLDCLHFDPPFFAALAGLSAGEGWMAEAVSTALGYASLLQDPESGLFYHFWLERPQRAYGLGWGRGQGWALLGLLDVLDRLQPGDAGWEPLASAAERLIEAMLRTQRADGSWHAVAGTAASGNESSTAAFMVIAFQRARRLGLGDSAALETAASEAWEATLGALDGSGLLTGVSAAVYSSTVDEHYHAVPVGFDVPWGQGPLLVAAAESAEVGGVRESRRYPLRNGHIQALASRQTAHRQRWAVAEPVTEGEESDVDESPRACRGRAAPRETRPLPDADQLHAGVRGTAAGRHGHARRPMSLAAASTTPTAAATPTSWNGPSATT